MVVTSGENPNIQASIQVKVVAAEIPLTGLAFTKPEQTVWAGEAVDATWTPTPQDATSYTVKLEFDQNVFTQQATSPNTLTVRAQAAAGEYTVKAVAYDKEGKALNVTAVLKVTVKKHVEKIEITQPTLTLTVGDNVPLADYIKVQPDDAFDKSYTVQSENESIAKVVLASENKYQVEAVAAGETKLVVTSGENPNIQASIQVKVVEAVIPLEGITAASPKQIVEVGSLIDLTLIFTPADATNCAVTWTTSDESVATVKSTAEGSWTAVAAGPGTVILTAKSQDGGHTATITVTVPYHVTEIKLTTTAISVKPAATFNPDTYVQAVLPAEVEDKSLTWTSSDDAVVQITGKVGAYTATAAAVGTATLTARSNENPAITATLTVTVTEEVIPLTGLAFTNAAQTVYAGEAVDVTWKPTPANASSYEVKLVFDEKVFEYKSNVMIVRPGVAAGDYTIVAQAYDADGKEMNVKATLTVTVRTHVSGLTISDELGGEPLSVTKDETVELNGYVVVTPADAYDKSLRWTSSNTSVATVAEKNGVWTVTGVAVGEATLTVTSVDNPDLTARLTVEVVEPVIPVTDFALSEKSILMVKDGEAKTIVLTPVPANATVDLMKFTVSVSDIYSQGKDWKYLDVAFTENDDRIEAVISAAYTWGVNSFDIFYDGKKVGTTVTVNVGAAMPFAKDWTWISTPSADYAAASLDKIALDDMGKTFGAALQEVRGESVLLYKDPDPDIAYFGDFGGLASNVVYKFNFTTAPNTFAIYNINRSITSSSVRSGWNWLAYPYEYAYSLSELVDSKVFASAAEGDQIVAPDAFATFSGGKWSGSLTTLEPSVGLMYYRAGSDASVAWCGYDVLGQKLQAKPQKVSGRHGSSDVWNYNARAFADNMPVVATVAGVDFPENCTVGAFVGEECRGKGVYADDRFFITVHGVSGESVSFVIYDEQTGEYRNVLGGLTFTDRAGSISHPLPLKVGERTTAIPTPVLMEETAPTFYDLQGRPVEAPAKGVYIVNGEKKIVK